MRRGAAAAAICLALAACVEQPGRSSGNATFVRHCSGCHGAGAAGDGPMAALVPGGVPDLTGLAARNGGVFPETYVVEAVTRISDFHADVVAMPDFGGLLDGPPRIHIAADGRRIETTAAVLAVVGHLRAIQR